jgi:hypothetical protein
LIRSDNEWNVKGNDFGSSNEDRNHEFEINSEYEDHLLKGIISHDCKTDSWADIDGTIVQKCGWDYLNVDAYTTDFSCRKSEFNQCPAGKFIWSVYRNPDRFDQLDAVYKARCASVNTQDKYHLNEYGNCYIQETSNDRTGGTGRDYTCERDGYYVAGFKVEADDCGTSAEIKLKCCAPWI